MKLLHIGDCGVDRYVDIRADRPGGITLNFAANALLCFAPQDEIAVLTVLGHDREATIVEQSLAGFGLDAMIAYQDDITPIQYIDRDPGGERLFLRYDAGALARHRLTAPEAARIAASDVVVTTVFPEIIDFFETVAAAVAPSDGLRVLDYCNPGPPEDRLAYPRRFTPMFDLAFISCDAADGARLDALEAIARESGHLIVATLGGEGSMALGGDSRVFCPPRRVADVVDTTGAGDTFAAGFLSVYCKGGSVIDALARGTAEAARTVRHMGAFPAEMIPWPDDAPAEWLTMGNREHS